MGSNELMICKKCDRAISDGAQFCEYCGNPVNGNGHNNQTKFKIIIYVLIVTVIIALAAVNMM